MALDHRTHGAVEEDDALAEQGFEGMKISRHVVSRELNGVSPSDQGTN